MKEPKQHRPTQTADCDKLTQANWSVLAVGVYTFPIILTQLFIYLYCFSKKLSLLSNSPIFCIISESCSKTKECFVILYLVAIRKQERCRIPTKIDPTEAPGRGTKYVSLILCITQNNTKYVCYTAPNSIIFIYKHSRI